MRKFSLLFAAMLLSAGTLLANADKPKNPSNDLSAQIGELLENNSFIVDNDLTAEVKFTVNGDREIVVLSVDTDNANLESFVKSRLNYEKVELQEYREGKTYTVPVRITE
ncbi:hypothetical protein [Muriicola sp. Z0-33]|uniref:hypothetical protein n=1 Tax=Muriicola sp. Z0-33 TaxID=2816957 RepID=UPI0022389A60|nr:hypothetical protein [Muriicola sp. Z0-33]MCW5515977.1 hypothetical protein [Muriicola sp. Z0-33]